MLPYTQSDDEVILALAGRASLCLSTSTENLSSTLVASKVVIVKLSEKWEQEGVAQNDDFSYQRVLGYLCCVDRRLEGELAGTELKSSCEYFIPNLMRSISNLKSR